ncbi:uncharacterized protein LOC133539480 [Nerophis ophidion]|uniref:uncharacterized protein LOC133539480 n=1 Tax=Nerophis ophidion TaxID=159077 RepID=UPI002ADF04D1|nr:uncharacterized protein LOC133539480 [Nerophis ophidion]
MTRRRSVVWDYFEEVGTEWALCLLCKHVLRKHQQGSTTQMLRHLRTKHTNKAVMELGRTEGQETSTGQQPADTGGAQVEVELEEADTNIIVAVNDTDIDYALTGILVAAQGEPMEEKTVEEVMVKSLLPLKTKSQRRSMIWRHFEHLESLDACQCLICNKKIKCSSESSTSNLHRHMSKRHPHVNLRTGEVMNQPTSNTSSDINLKHRRKTFPSKLINDVAVSVDMEMEETDSNIIAVNDPDIDSALNGILEAAQGDKTDEVVQNPLPSKTKSQRRSMIWRHFERLESLDACQCLICNKKIKWSGEGSTSNLHRHLSKRHPHVNLRTGKVMNQPTSNTSSDIKDVTVSDVLQVSQATAGERSAFKRELELIEALRSAQREEAQALEHQRELVEKLRAINAREAALEKEQIEFLRRAQQEEAQKLNRQREELEVEKAALQRK